MNIRAWWYFSRCWSVLLVAFLVTPTGASTIAPSQPRFVVQPGIIQGQGSPAYGGLYADFDRSNPVVLLATADSLRAGGSLVPHASQAPEAPSAPLPSMSNAIAHLPEPGPISAILATLALAGFVLVRRLS